jgi:hypothetical protein
VKRLVGTYGVGDWFQVGSNSREGTVRIGDRAPPRFVVAHQASPGASPPPVAKSRVADPDKLRLRRPPCLQTQGRFLTRLPTPGPLARCIDAVNFGGGGPGIRRPGMHACRFRRTTRRDADGRHAHTGRATFRVWAPAARQTPGTRAQPGRPTSRTRSSRTPLGAGGASSRV